jgi:CDGSH-type Zn-finger protein
MSVRICPRPRGPLLVEGDIELYDVNGARLETANRTRILLCRCGASRTSPFCDGSHNRVGFDPEGERA